MRDRLIQNTTLTKLESVSSEDGVRVVSGKNASKSEEMPTTSLQPWKFLLGWTTAL